MIKILKYILFYSRFIILYRLLFLDNLNRDIINELFSYFRIMSTEYSMWVISGEANDERFLDIFQIITSIGVIIALLRL